MAEFPTAFDVGLTFEDPVRPRRPFLDVFLPPPTTPSSMLLPLLAAHLLSPLAPLALGLAVSPAGSLSGASALAQGGGPDLLSTIPQSAIAAFHASNPKALIASRDTSDWVQFMLDARWELIIGDLATMLGEGKATEEIVAARRTLIQALADTTGAAAFVDMDSESGDFTTCLIAQGGPECSALLREFVGDDAAPQTLADGKTVLVGEAGRAELFYEGEGMVMLISAKSIEESKSVAEGCLARLGSAKPGGPFAVPGVAEERTPAAFEFAVNMAPLWDKAAADAEGEGAFVQSLVEDARSIEWAYGSMEFGEGENAEWNFAAPYGEETLIGEAVGFFGEANLPLLRTVPAGALQASVLSIDLGGLTDWALGLIAEESEELHTQALGGIDAAGQAIGVDILNDLVRNLTGQYVYYTTGSPIKVEGETLPGSFAPTVISYVRDSEVLIDVADTLLQLGGIASDLNSGERTLPGDDGEVELWISTEASELQMGIGVGAGRVAFSMSPSDLGKYFDLAEGKNGAGRMLDNGALAKSIKGLRGAIVGIQSTANMADSVELMMNSYADMMQEFAAALGSEGTDGLAAMRASGDRFAAIVHQYFKGATTSELQLGGGMLRFKTRSR